MIFTKNLDNTVAFGSTKDLRPVGTVLFVNSPFPVIKEEELPPVDVIIGPYAPRVPLYSLCLSLFVTANHG